MITAAILTGSADGIAQFGIEGRRLKLPSASGADRSREWDVSIILRVPTSLRLISDLISGVTDTSPHVL